MKYILIILFIIAPFIAISLTITHLYYNVITNWLFKSNIQDRTIFNRHTTAFIIDP